MVEVLDDDANPSFILELRIGAHDLVEIGILLVESPCEPEGNVSAIKNSGKIHAKNAKPAFRDDICQEINIDSRCGGIPRYHNCCGMKDVGPN
jgi:hypothetical protein